jgi:hypothetical protein
MCSDKIHLQLQPLHDGSFTQLLLSGPIATALPARELRRLLTMLAFWSGSAVVIALDVDGPANWLEEWTGMLIHVPKRHFQLRLRPGRGVAHE